MRKVAIGFLVLAIVFIALGLSGQRIFLWIGLVFLVIAMLRILPRRRR